MKKLVLGLLAILLGAATVGGGAPPVLISPSATTLFLSWTSSVAGATTSACGPTIGSNAFPDTWAGSQTSVTAHMSMVAGLAPSTTYWCQAQDGTNTFVFRATTLVAPAAPALSSATFSVGSVASNGQNSGDTYFNTTAENGVTYVVTNDSNTGWGGSSFSPMMVGSLDSSFHGTNVNRFANFTALGEPPKLFGMMSYNAALYAIYSNICVDSCGTPTNVYSQTFGSLIKSPDHGATWSNGQAPGTFSAGGAVMSSTFTMFDTASGCAQSAFVTYGADNGSPLTSVRVDNGDAYAYFLCTSPVPGQTASGFQFNGDSFYLARMPLADLPGLSSARMQYYIGGTSGNGIDGSLAGAWKAGYSGAVPILTNAGKISNAQMAYFPLIGRYVIFDWYWPTPGTWNNSIRITYECAHPWSCTTTPIEGPTSITPQGFYNATVYAPSALTATRGGAAATLLLGGDFSGGGSGPFYQLYLMTMTLQ